MLRIRAEQMKVFEAAAAGRFEDDLVGHFKLFAPRHSEAIGEPVVRQVIRLGRERAEKYGLTFRGPVQFYVELMFMLGSDFDTDPQLPWAGAILNTTAVSEQVERASRLYDKANAYLEQVSGPDNEYLLVSLRRLSRGSLEDYTASGADFEDAFARSLQDIYPQKCAYLGESSLRGVIQLGLASAKYYSVTSKKGAALFAALTLVLGRGFAADPLLPWVSATLSDSHVTDADERVELLYTKLKLHLDYAFN